MSSTSSVADDLVRRSEPVDLDRPLERDGIQTGRFCGGGAGTAPV